MDIDGRDMGSSSTGSCSSVPLGAGWIYKLHTLDDVVAFFDK